MMDIEAFPEIESFHKLPRQVIVKAGSTRFEDKEDGRLQGIVINNTGHAIRDLSVGVVLFNEKKIPIMNSSAAADPGRLSQGGIANFHFQFKGQTQPVADYYLYTHWRFDDEL